MTTGRCCKLSPGLVKALDLQRQLQELGRALRYGDSWSPFDQNKGGCLPVLSCAGLPLSGRSTLWRAEETLIATAWIEPTSIRASLVVGEVEV